MIGFDAIGFAPITGPTSNSSSTPLVYEPISRIIAGGFSSGRAVEVAVLGVDLIWDDEQIMTWDDDTEIGWEA